MSRADIKAVREIRAAESMQLRKQLLKGSGNSAKAQEAMTSMASESNSQYEERLAKLNKFKNKSKQKVKVNSQKHEWLKEHETLRKNTMILEQDLEHLVGKLLVETALEGVMVEASDDILQGAQERKSHEVMLTSQWNEIKAMVHQVQSVKDTNKSTPAQNLEEENQAPRKKTKAVSFANDVNEHDGTMAEPGVHSKQEPGVGSMTEKQSEGNLNKSHNPRNEAAGLVANLFLRIRETHEAGWKALNDAVQALNIELVIDRRNVLTEVRKDQENLLHSEITNEIRCIPGDDAETELFVEESLQKLNHIMKTHADMLSLLQDQVKAVCAKYHCMEGDRTGGWKPADHELFVKIIKRAELAGTARKLIMDQFSRQLSHIPYTEIDSHEEWYREIRLLQAKKHELVQGHKSQMSDLVAATKVDLVKFRVQREEARKYEAELVRFEERRQDLHMILSQQRAEKEVRDALNAQRQADLERVQQEENALLLEKARERAEQMKVLVGEYRARREAEAAQEAERLRVEQQQREERIRIEIEENREKVEQRHEQYWEKERLRKKQEEELQQKEVMRLELLAKIVEQCPYWEGLQNVHSKLDHITTAAAQAMYQKGEDLTRGHMPLQGFADKNVIKDTRFKLISALRNAGVAHSEYAKTAVAKINPMPHLAIHGIL